MLSAMDRYRLANRALWNEWTAINVRAETFYRLEEFRAGGVRVRDYEIEEVGPVTGKDLLHLQCHFGTDTLSWARLGARVTGADFSEPAIGRARSLAAELGIAATFVCAELYELPERLDGDFDVVYTSRGVLGWLPDIPRWAGVVARFLRPGGIFYITEVHPVALAFDDRSGVTDLRLHFPYWSRPEPIVIPTRGSYADRTAKVEQPFEYGWSHGLGEIVTALASAGLRIDFLRERPFLEWEVPFLTEREPGRWQLPEGQELPLSFSLKATKPA